MRVVLLAIEGMFDTGLSVLLDTLATANELSTDPRPPFRVRVAGVRDAVATQQGFRIPIIPVSEVPSPALVS